MHGIGPVTVQKLLPHLGSLPQMSAHEISQHAGITPAAAKQITLDLANSDAIEKELAQLNRCNAHIITILDTDYPERLKNIYAPPPVLYFQGAHPSSDRACAFVGSRAANSYGKRVLSSLIPPLVEHGCTIVSGGARGIDAYAHYETIQAKGKTVVVLGSGLLKPYPPENKKLFSSILDAGGTILSPFPLAMDPSQGNFPARNRIIAGLSHTCVVVQAAAKSGALITAKYALEQGREVLAVPGQIDDALSAGCHSLLQQGAGLVQSAHDILETLGISVIGNSDPDQKKVDSKDLPLAQRIQILCSEQAQSLDDLADALEIDAAKLHGPLFQLQIAGSLIQNIAGLYESPRPF